MKLNRRNGWRTNHELKAKGRTYLQSLEMAEQLHLKTESKTLNKLTE